MTSESNEVEELAREFHSVYQKEAERQGKKNHPDDYDKLSEQIKEFDRVLARHVLDKFHPKQDSKVNIGNLVLDKDRISKRYGSNMLGVEEVIHFYPGIRKDTDSITIGNDDGGFISFNKDEALAIADWIKDKLK